MELESLRAAIGPNAEFYLRRFERLQKEEIWGAGWNWAAFFCSTGWFFYRRMYLYGVMNAVAPWLIFWLAAISRDLGLLLFGLLIAYPFIAFLLIPVCANAIYFRFLKAKSSFPPPSVATGGAGAALFMLGPALFVALAYLELRDYAWSSRVREGFSMASGLRTPLEEFYEEKKRLPLAHEAEKFRVDGRFAREAAYDPARKMIVVTMRDPFPGKQFGMDVVERGGKLDFRCRSIDIEPKYLHRSCRGND